MMQCLTTAGSQHTGLCCGGGFGVNGKFWQRCNKTAKWHVHYGTGCGEFCGIHANKMKRKRPESVMEPMRARERGAGKK